MNHHEGEKTWRIKTTNDGRWLFHWRRGYALPLEMSAVIDGGEDLPYLIELELVASDEDVSCTSARFVARADGRPVTARGLREIPLGECIHFAVATALRPVIEEPGSLAIPLVPGDGDMVDEYELARPGAKRPRRVLTDQHLREVAQVYLKAEGEKPTKAVQNHPSWAPLAYSTAARWVMEARDRDDPLTGRKFLEPVSRKEKDDA
ncbi:MAG: hypothetical protein ABSC51_06135 [Gaiellaceae bacterium]|jgi:hypothetical protein